MITRRHLLLSGLSVAGAVTTIGRLGDQASSHTLLLTDGAIPPRLDWPRETFSQVAAPDTLIALALAHLARPARTVIAVTEPRTHLLLTFALHDVGASLTEHGSVLFART